jgi:hypothetical protein
MMKKYFDKLEAMGYVGEELCQGKNDYGSGGIVYGLFIAPKVKYTIVLIDGILIEKKTFKGLNKESLNSNDFFTLASGSPLEREVKKPWQRDFKKGIRIPDKEKEMIKKEFNQEINLLKRRKPDENGVMWPYYITNPSKIVPLTDCEEDQYGECELDIFDDESVTEDDSDDDVVWNDIEREQCSQQDTSWSIPSGLENNEASELLPDPSVIFVKCYKCKEVKCLLDYYESKKNMCKKCINNAHIQWLKTPKAKIQEELRNRLKKAAYVEHLTGLSLNKLNEWLEFTKRFYVPKDYTGSLDIEHQYPLSKYDLTNEENVAHCCNWKHLRYWPSEDNKKKGSKMPSHLKINLSK